MDRAEREYPSAVTYPSSASMSAVCEPMPPDAPVTIAVFIAARLQKLDRFAERFAVGMPFRGDAVLRWVTEREETERFHVVG